MPDAEARASGSGDALTAEQMAGTSSALSKYGDQHQIPGLTLSRLGVAGQEADLPVAAPMSHPLVRTQGVRRETKVSGLVEQMQEKSVGEQLISPATSGRQPRTQESICATRSGRLVEDVVAEDVVVWLAANPPRRARVSTDALKCMTTMTMTRRNEEYGQKKDVSDGAYVQSWEIVGIARRCVQMLLLVK